MKQLMPSGFRSKERMMPARLATAAIALCLPIFLGGCQFLEPIADDADSGAFDPRKVLAVSFLVGGGLFLKSGGSSNSSTSTPTDGMMQPPPSLAQEGCIRCGSANARQVDYVPGTSLDTYTFDPDPDATNPVTPQLNLDVVSGVRRTGLPIATLIPDALSALSALSDGISANGEIPRLNVDAYADDPADATQRNLAVVFEMEFGALGLWMLNPGTFFLGGQTDYTRGDFTSNTFFDHFGVETLVDDIPLTGTADFDGVINAISHTSGRSTPGNNAYFPASAIFVASEPFTMQANFGTNALTSPDRMLRFDRQYYGTGGAAEVFGMLVTDPVALLAGNAYSSDIGSQFQPASTNGNLRGNPSSWTFNGLPASGNGIISGTNDWRLSITRPTTNTCCHGLGPGVALTINGKFYGPNAEEAIGVGRVDTNGNGGEFIVGIFARQRE